MLRYEIEKLKASNDKMRKALFAKHGELAKNYLDLLHRLEIIERHICKGGMNEQNNGDVRVSERASKEIRMPSYSFESAIPDRGKDLVRELREVCG